MNSYTSLAILKIKKIVILCYGNFLNVLINLAHISRNNTVLLQEDIFHSYCKPVLETKLTKFCKELTHITQVTMGTSGLTSTPSLLGTG